MSQTAAQPAQWRPKANPWLIAVAVTLAAFMEVLDTTIVNVSLPHIAGSLSSSIDDATWTLTSYLVANGIVLPISGYLGRLLGRKRYFLICIAGFTMASLLCGIATSLPEIIIFRLFQGFFGGGLQPNQQSIMLDTFEPSQRGKAFAVTAIATICAPVIGPSLGGWITDSYSWRWIFFINVPVGILTFFAVTALVEDPPWEKTHGKVGLDYIGLGLIALGLGCMQVFLDRGEDDDWLGSGFIRAMLAMSVIGISGAICWLLYAKKPIVNIRVLADRTFALGCGAIFVMAMILYSSAILLPQLAQRELGYNATWAGFILSPGAALILLLIPIVGRLTSKVQLRALIATGFAILGFAFLYSRNLTADIDFRTLAKMRAFQTIGLAFLFVPISTIAYRTIPKEMNGDAAALFTMFRNVAGSIGISVATALVTERTQAHQAHLSKYMTPLYQPFNDTVARTQAALQSVGAMPELATGLIYRTLTHQAAILAYMDVFFLCAVAAFAVVPLCLLFVPVKGGGKPGVAH
jgi:DHA2 family multidrug resistance protein